MVVRAARQWWTQSNSQALLDSQDRLLKAFVKAPFVRKSAAGVNSVEFSKNGGSCDSPSTIVLAHGFGSGLGFFYNNVDSLIAHQTVGRVILVDWLGMGGSERPQCFQRPIRGLMGDFGASLCNSRFTPLQAVDFFIDPFQEWMESMVPDSQKVTLMGHSLGGYLAAHYALRYPSRVDKLVLASPVGIPPKPTNTFRGSQMPTSLRIIDALWSSNITPQQLVRLMGATRGRRNVKRALHGRIPHLRGHDVDLLADYLYHITVAHPSGEFAMNSLLEPVASPDMMGVFAREPLHEKLLELDSNISRVKIIYGDHDWMRPNEPSARLVMSELRKRSGLNTSVDIVPSAGHHLYLENPSEFARHILD